MALFNRRNPPHLVSLLASGQGESTLKLVFRGSQIHLDPNRMEPGAYQLKVAQGKKISLRKFTVLTKQ